MMMLKWELLAIAMYVWSFIEAIYEAWVSWLTNIFHSRRVTLLQDNASSTNSA